MTTIGNDTLKRCRIDGDEVAEITVGGDTVFLLDADLVLDLFNTGAISADTLGIYHNTIFDSLDVTVGGNTDFTTRSVSQATSGNNFDINVDGNYQPTGELITINGNGSLQDTSTTTTSPTVDGLAPPLNETATVSTSQNEYGYTGGTEEFRDELGGTENQLLVVGEGTQSATVDNTGGIDTVAEIYAKIGTNLDNYMEYDVYIDGTYFDTITIYNGNGGYETLNGGPISIGDSFEITFEYVDADWDGADPQIDIAVYSDSEDPFYIRSPDPEPTINHADGTTATTGDGTYSIGLALGANTVSLSYDGGNASIDQISWTEDFRAQDPSVAIDESSVSHSGPLANGETETGSVDITGTGTYPVSVSTNGEVTVDVDWTERNVVKDVDFTFNGVTESITGPILNDEQSTLGFGVADIIDGNNSVDVTAGGNSNPDLQLTFLLNTEDAMALTDFEPNWDYGEKGDNVLLEYWFDVSNVDAPAEAVEGDPFSVDATIENIGITPVEQDVVMTHTGETLTKTKNLNDKESINVTFDTVINSPGEQTIVVESPQESASDLIQILSKYQLDITIDGASNINTEINSDYSTNVYPSFSPSVYVNGSLAGTATNNSGEDIDVSASVDSVTVTVAANNYVSALNQDGASFDFRGIGGLGGNQAIAGGFGLNNDITILEINATVGFSVENSQTLIYNDSSGTEQSKQFSTVGKKLVRGTDFPSDAYVKEMQFDVNQDTNSAGNEGIGGTLLVEIPASAIQDSSLNTSVN